MSLIMLLGQQESTIPTFEAYNEEQKFKTAEWLAQILPAAKEHSIGMDEITQVVLTCPRWYLAIPKIKGINRLEQTLFM